MKRLGIVFVVAALGALTCAVPANAAATLGPQPGICQGGVSGQGTSVQASLWCGDGTTTFTGTTPAPMPVSGCSPTAPLFTATGSERSPNRSLDVAASWTFTLVSPGVYKVATFSPAGQRSGYFTASVNVPTAGCSAGAWQGAFLAVQKAACCSPLTVFHCQLVGTERAFFGGSFTTDQGTFYNWDGNGGGSGTCDSGAGTWNATYWANDYFWQCKNARYCNSPGDIEPVIHLSRGADTRDFDELLVEQNPYTQQERWPFESFGFGPGSGTIPSGFGTIGESPNRLYVQDQTTFTIFTNLILVADVQPPI